MAPYFTRWGCSLTLGAVLALNGAVSFANQQDAPAPAEREPRLIPSEPDMAALSEAATEMPSEFAPEAMGKLRSIVKVTGREVDDREPKRIDAAVEVVRERYPDRTVKVEREVTQDEQGNYVNHGMWRMWNQKGNIIAEGEYVDGTREGIWNRWLFPADARMLSQIPYQQFPGPFISQATFINGQIDGAWIIYDSKQRKISHWEYQAGVRHGLSQWWYANGKPMRQASYRHGDLDGEVRQYDANGQLVGKETYQLGRKLALKTDYHQGGNQKKTEGVYLHAKIAEKNPEDWWNVVPAVTMLVGKDEKHGPWTSWYPNGQVKIQGEYKHNLEVGQFVWWYQNGQKATEGNYIEGQPHGTWTWWHDNGQKSSQGEYSRGDLVGMWSSWDNNGKLVRAEDHTHSTYRTAEQPQPRR